MPLNPVKSIFSIIQKMSHIIKIAFSNSILINRIELNKLFQGILQGNEGGQIA